MFSYLLVERIKSNVAPTIGGKPIDLFTLYESVVSLGGYDAVCQEKGNFFQSGYAL